MKMPRGKWFMGFGWKALGWPGNPYPFCRCFPWLPRWWWSGIYGTNPWMAQYYLHNPYAFRGYWR